MAEQTKDKNTPPHAAHVLTWLGVLCVLVLIATFASLAVPKLFGWEGSDNINWVLLLFGGFAFLLVSMFSASVLFRFFGIHDTDHSLALPRNSIRSLLTFLIFMILMTFIFYSTHIVASKDIRGEMTIAKDGYVQTIKDLNLEGRVTKIEELEGDANTPGKVRVHFLVEEESVSLEYLNQILVALLGISSTIIGFYFGTRSQEDRREANAEAADEGDVAGQPEEAVPPEGDDADGLEWAITSETLKLTATEGGLTGEVFVAADALDDLGEFAAQFEPTTSHDAATDTAEVRVSRLGDRLTLTVEGLTPEDIDETAKMSIFYRDQEERAQAVPVELA